MPFESRKPKPSAASFVEADDEIIIEVRTSAADAKEESSQTYRGFVMANAYFLTDPQLFLYTEDLSVPEWDCPSDPAEKGQYLRIPWALILSIKKIGMDLEPPFIVEPDFP
jgi:hypothetical protein